ncbi:MAG: InlB B-repeat-containing protein, partial [Clostridia bacterium]|nr:InlB B-repeat-containing protein [Clostridia bacterium]
EEATKIISFDPDDGLWSDGTNEIKTEKVNLDYNAEKYIAPTKRGYDFGGWKKKDTAVSGADESYIAIWILGKTVTFKDGDTVYEDNYAFGETVTSPDLAEKVGYTFVGWDLVGLNGLGNGFKDQVISVMGNESLVYVAIWQANEYTVYFYNENDELIEAITAKYGAPFGISITPTKTGHTFVGWDLKKDGKYDAIADAVSPTMGAEDLEYREIFAIGQYTITFDSAGGSTVAPITQSYGTDIVVPADPTKEGYKFAGWDQGVPLTMPALNITLTARWEKAKYNISWDMNADGVIDDRDIVTTVEHGDIPVLPEAEVPVKESTAEFSYVFTNSWLPAIKPVEGDATYTAQYDTVLRKYTVKFLNYDGTPLQTSEVEYGSTPVYSGSTPFKIDDKQYDYTFAGWSPTVESVTKDAVYTATFTESIKKYTVVWKNWDGSVLETDHAVEHGDFPKYNGKTPTKPATEAVNYVFEGWEPQISGLTGDVTYTATFKEEAKTFSITWLAEDGSIIDVTVVEYGKIPAYAAPMKPSTAEYSYAFAGWTPSVVAVSDDATYTASYIATKNKYTVTWNVDGDRTSESYEYGVLPEFKGLTDKASEGCTVYSFLGWNKLITEVASNVEYIATYSTATVHISTEIVYSDITKTTHDEIYACCKAVKNDNAAHNFINNYCVCGAKKTVTIVIMNGDSVWETIESEDTDISVSDMPTPTPTPGYVFSGWYTEDGVRVDSETKLTDDMVLHAGYFSGDVDGDGTIEKEDVDKLTRYIVGQDVATVEDEKAFDINGDGDVTVVDSILLLLHISGKRPMTP